MRLAMAGCVALCDWLIVAAKAGEKLAAKIPSTAEPITVEKSDTIAALLFRFFLVIRPTF